MKLHLVFTVLLTLVLLLLQVNIEMIGCGYQEETDSPYGGEPLIMVVDGVCNSTSYGWPISIATVSHELNGGKTITIANPLQAVSGLVLDTAILLLPTAVFLIRKRRSEQGYVFSKKSRSS